MKSFNYTVTDALGIHARPAGLLVKLAATYTSKVTISEGGKSADGKRLFALMGMGVKQGSKVTVSVEGADEDAASKALQSFFTANL